jgi:hypothetical protein
LHLEDACKAGNCSVQLLSIKRGHSLWSETFLSVLIFNF